MLNGLTQTNVYRTEEDVATFDVRASTVPALDRHHPFTQRTASTEAMLFFTSNTSKSLKLRSLFLNEKNELIPLKIFTDRKKRSCSWKLGAFLHKPVVDEINGTIPILITLALLHK